MPLSHPRGTQDRSLLYATRNNWRTLCLNDFKVLRLNIMHYSAHLNQQLRVFRVFGGFVFGFFLPRGLHFTRQRGERSWLYDQIAVVILERPSGFNFRGTFPSSNIYQRGGDFRMHAGVAPWAARDWWEILMSALRSRTAADYYSPCDESAPARSGKSVQLLLSAH